MGEAQIEIGIEIGIQDYMLEAKRGSCYGSWSEEISSFVCGINAGVKWESCHVNWAFWAKNRKVGGHGREEGREGLSFSL